MTEADFFPRFHVFILDPDLKTSASSFSTMAPDLQAKLREDVAPIWGVGNGDFVQATPLAAGEGHPLGAVPIYVHAKAPQDIIDAGALAEHGDDPDGVPRIDVYEDLIAMFGISPQTPTLEDALSAAIDHELTEYRIDPECDRVATLPDGRVVAVEACDQVQAQTYRKGATCVSNFNTPSNFGIGSNSPPFDFLGKQTAQFQCEPGGYEQVLDPDRGWQMITADLAGATHETLRDKISAVPHGMLRYRLELTWRGLGRGRKRRRRHLRRHAAEG